MAVTGCGGKIKYDTYPSLHYRQHGGNIVGMNSDWAARRARIRMLCRASAAPGATTTWWHCSICVPVSRRRTGARSTCWPGQEELARATPDRFEKIRYLSPNFAGQSWSPGSGNF
jgi:hypothetical protein